ncbi:hypothetical protein NHX12_025085, partial [Muraenolepis orangiensis]
SFCRERGFDLATVDDMGALASLLPLIDHKFDAVWIGLRGGGPLRAANRQGRDRYVVVSQKMTALAAMQHCRKHHTDLVAIRNQTEDQIVTELSTINIIWIGLFRDMWHWSDRRDSSFRAWLGDTLVPNADDTLCATLNAAEAGGWNVLSCAEKRPFLCTFVPCPPPFSPPPVATLPPTDESEEVEHQVQMVIQEMENILGEPLQSYF